ncbi:hypothetical protein BMS3Abin03_00017 [bacterium BMS3Abin03]|nr:hypothetical protein BMS3Abin03_00017 [bacterium BMS3Abin03]
MSFSDILIPRKEVLRKEGIQGIIDLENLRSKKRKTIETSPEEFLNLTFPTGDVKTVLENLHQRFNSSEPTAGLFLLEGFKGSGKSHLELLIYHLFTNSRLGQEWLKKNNLECILPENAIVTIHKFTDFPMDSLWTLVFEKLNASTLLEKDSLPNLDKLREALNGKQLVLILDEVELGFDSIPNKHQKAQNLSFLQMLSEEANRSENASVTIFASVYDANNEPGATLKRVPRIDIKFSEPQDRKRVVLHRLFSNYGLHDKAKVETVVQSYVNQWKRNDVLIDEKYIDEFKESYPFSPELMDMLMNRVLRKNFQGNRGPLGLLGRVVRNNHKIANVLTAAHLNLNDKGISNLLIDLDPNQVFIQCAQNDLNDLQERVLANEIVSATLIATLSSTGNIKGIKDYELARQIINPDVDYNDYTTTLFALEKYGAFFQHTEDNYFFDTQEKPYAKVEYKSLRIDDGKALEFALDRWSKYVFNDASAVVLRDLKIVKSQLMQLDKNSPRIVLSPNRLQDNEREELYKGLENQNLVILLEPRSDSFSVFTNQDIIKWAKLSLAAADLKTSASSYDRKRQYERIEIENAKYIDDAFRKAGLSYVIIRVENGKLKFELESLSKAYTRQDVIDYLKQNVYPRQVFEEHILKGIELRKESKGDWILNLNIKQILDIYRKTLGFPVLLAYTNLIHAIKILCVEKKIGLSHSRKSFCGSNPTYSESEWSDVIIVEPFFDEREAKSTTVPSGKESVEDSATAKFESEEETTSDVSDLIEIQNIYTTNLNSTGGLRQEIASKLNNIEDAVIRKVRFTIYFNKSKVELNTLPVSLRGQLTGQSDVYFELAITKNGAFSKSQVEQMAEQLTSFPGASYKAELGIEIKKSEVIDERQ